MPVIRRCQGAILEVWSSSSTGRTAVPPNRSVSWPPSCPTSRRTWAVILRSGIGPTVPSPPGPTKIVCEDVPAPPDRPLAARKGTLPGKLQDVLGPARWGQKKLGLARWSRFDLVRWSQGLPVESGPQAAQAAYAAYRAAGGPARLSRPADFATRPSPCRGHLLQFYGRRALDRAESAENRARSRKRLDQILSQPLTMSRIDRLLSLLTE
jgi:hypothetical protein